MDIDPRFSIYDIVHKEHPSNIFLTTVRHLIHFSNVIEKEVIAGNFHTPIYIGIQSVAKIAPILATYEGIANFAETVYFFGVADGDLPAHKSLQFIPLQPEARLTQEWFLLINHPHYTKLLSARESTTFKDKDGDERTFDAVLTSERKIVQDTANAISMQLDVARHK